MESSWGSVLWPQFGAAIDMLEHAVIACPDALWTERLWNDRPDQPPPEEFPPAFAEFWYLTVHATTWLDLYLSGISEETYVPPAPFTRGERDSRLTTPTQPYTKAELLAFIAYARQKARNTLLALTDEQARRTFTFPGQPERPISYVELQLYSMRHMQEHASQLSLFLGQHAVPDVPDWVSWAEGESSPD